MLTENQSKIIDDLQANLEVLNSRSSLPKGNLLNLGELLQKQEEDHKAQEEITLINQAFLNLRKEAVNRDFLLLQEDLDALGVTCRLIDGNCIVIGGGMVNRPIRIYYCFGQESVKLPLGSYVSKTGGMYLRLWDNGGQVENIQDALKNPYVQVRLAELISIARR